jgi:hypothetical protein
LQSYCKKYLIKMRPLIVAHVIVLIVVSSVVFHFGHLGGGLKLLQIGVGWTIQFC